MAQASTLCLPVEAKAAPLLGAVSPSPTSSADSQNSVCYICHSESDHEALITNICACKGQKVHARCLATWLHYSASKRDGSTEPTCEVCLQAYDLPKSMRVLVYPGRRTSPPVRGDEAVIHFTRFKDFCVPAVFAFLYGFFFTMLTPTHDLLMYVCAAGNVFIVLLWCYFVVKRNRFILRRTAEKKAVEDIMILILVYVIFVIGWALHELSLPDYQPPKKFAVAHIANGATVVLCTFVRLMSLLCRLYGCCCNRAAATISLDLEH